MRLILSGFSQFNASICDGGRHSWVVVTINGTQVSIETVKNSTGSFVCGDGFAVIFVQDGDPIIQPDPGAIIPQPSVVYDNIMRRLKIMDAGTIGGL